MATAPRSLPVSVGWVCLPCLLTGHKVQDRVEVTCASALGPALLFHAVLVYVCRGDMGHRLSRCVSLWRERPSVLELLITCLKQNTQPQNAHATRLPFRGLLRPL